MLEGPATVEGANGDKLEFTYKAGVRLRITKTNTMTRTTNTTTRTTTTLERRNAGRPCHS